MTKFFFLFFEMTKFSMKWRQFKDNQNYQIAYRLDYISLQPLIRDLGNPETSKNYKYSNKFEFLKFC